MRIVGEVNPAAPLQKRREKKGNYEMGHRGTQSERGASKICARLRRLARGTKIPQ